MKNVMIIMLCLSLIVVALALSGCGGTKKTLLIEETTKVAMPPDALWKCPDVQIPADITMQSEVADYVLELYEAHQVCKESLEGVRAWLIKAEKITEDGKN